MPATPNRHRRVPAALAGLVALSLAPAAAAAPGWVAPATLTPDPVFSRAAMGDAGDAGVTWLASPLGEGVWSAVRPAGGAWGAAESVQGTGQGGNMPGIAMGPAGDATEVWWQETAGTPGGAWRPTAGTWQARQPLAPAGEMLFTPWLAAGAGGEVVAAWHVFGAGTGRVMAAVRGAGGAWGAPSELSATALAAGSYLPGAIAANTSGDAVVAWLRNNADASQRVVEAAVRHGGAWGGAQVVAPSPVQSVGGVAVAPDGTMAVAWSRVAGGTHAVQVAVRPPGGAWGPAETVPGAVGGPRPFVAFGAGGELVAVWLGGGSVRTAVRSTSGAWGSPTALSGLFAADPVLAVGRGGDMTAAWAQGFAAAGFKQITAAVRPAGGAWGAATGIGVAAGLGSMPSAAMDAAGDGIVSWTQQGAGVIARGYDGAGPVLSGISVPGTAVAGKAVKVSAAATDVWSPIGRPTGWAFGDGTAPATSLTATHVFLVPGHYTLTAGATDALGNTTTATRSILVKPALTTVQDRTAPGLVLTAAGVRVHRHRVAGLWARVRLDEVAGVTLEVRTGRVVRARGTAVFTRAGTRIVRLALTAAGRRIVGSRAPVRMTLLARAADRAGNRSARVLPVSLLLRGS